MAEETTIKPKDWFKRYDDPVTAQIDDAELMEAKQSANNHPAPVTPPNPAAPRVAGIRHGGSAPMERLDAPQVQPNTPRQNVVMPDAEENYGTVGANQVRYDDLPSTQMMRVWQGKPTDFRGAAQRNSEMWGKGNQADQMVNRLEQIQQRAQAAREQKEKNRKVEQSVAEQGIAKAYGMAIDAWRKANLRNGLEADRKTKTDNRYRVGMVEPQTLRELNAMIAPIVGMRNGEKIVGIYAASSVDANGTDRGQPTVFVRWRRPDGTIKQEPISYREAAQYVRNTMGNSGDRETDRNFVLQYGNTWRNAAGDGDELGLSKTPDYVEWKQKQDAAKSAAEGAALKSRLVQQQIDQNATTFKQAQEDRAEAKENAPVAALEKERNDLYGLLQKTTDPAMRDKIANRIMEIGDGINSERGKLAAKKTDAERKAEAANSKPGDRVTFEPLAYWDETKNMSPVVGAEEFTDPRTGKKGFRVMKGVATGADGKPKYDDNGKLILEKGWAMGDDGRPVKVKKPGAKPKAAQSDDSTATTQKKGSVGKALKRVMDSRAFQEIGKKYDQMRQMAKRGRMEGAESKDEIARIDALEKAEKDAMLNKASGITDERLQAIDDTAVRKIMDELRKSKSHQSNIDEYGQEQAEEMLLNAARERYGLDSGSFMKTR